MRVSSLVYPTTNATFIAGFLKDAWKRGFFTVRAEVGNLHVRGGLWNEPSWQTKVPWEAPKHLDVTESASLSFLLRYLSGLPNPVLIFLTSPNFFPAAGLSVPTEFPTLNPRPHLFAACDGPRYEAQVYGTKVNSDDAIAGIQGTAAVVLTVEGLPLFLSLSDSHAALGSGWGSGEQSSHPPQAPSNYIVLAGLPFQGSVRINMKFV
ncbi:hypothetical protein EST38_g10702 [Candolleomyces aberdarensis]|uniref:Uncharacterized protein n=1 Tax=Candolleomyces aberdarensis TaxID=2316362 RepID=A0A4Q2D9L2_9AGAR|nr:hypothetical protein EST38_g10702 [Candolleomyces aberdarensis]